MAPVERPHARLHLPHSNGRCTVAGLMTLRNDVLHSIAYSARPRPSVDPGATEYYRGAREMLVTVKSSISLTDEQHAFAKALVETGRYSSLSAVLQRGVDLLRQRMDIEELESAALRELLSRRRQGEFVDAKGMDARLDRMVADKRRAHDLPS